MECEIDFCLSNPYAGGVAEAVEPEQLAFVILVIAEDTRLCNLAAFDQLGKTEQPAELRFQIEPVALVRHKINVALAGIKYIEERRDIKVVQVHDWCHLCFSLLKLMCHVPLAIQLSSRLFLTFLLYASFRKSQQFSETFFVHYDFSLSVFTYYSLNYLYSLYTIILSKNIPYGCILLNSVIFSNFFCNYS